MKTMGEREVEDLYKRYFPVIRRKCERMVRNSDEAQDLAQETFARLWANRETLRDVDAVVGWIYRTATRVAINRIRRDRLTLLDIEAASPESGAADQIEARQELQRMFQHMKPRELEVMILSRVDRLTQDEISTVMSISSRTVRRILSNGDERLQRLQGSGL
jgi:RNA polymerase sigma-70 factor, ECF subfamily